MLAISMGLGLFCLPDSVNAPARLMGAVYDKGTSILRDSYIGTAYYKTRNWVAPSPLVKQLRELAKQNDIQDLQPIITALTSAECASVWTELYRIFDQKVSDHDLNHILKGAYAFVTQNPASASILNKNLKNTLTLAKIEQAIKSEYPRFGADDGVGGALQTAEKIGSTAKRESVVKSSQQRNTYLRLTKYYVLQTLDWIIDTLMYVLLIKKVTDGDASRLEKQMIADMQFRALRENITLISACLIGLSIYTGSVAAAVAIVGGTILALVTLGTLYIKYFKPPPSDLHPARNVTELALKGKLTEAMFREKIVEKIATLVSRNNSKHFRRFVLLVGASGVGKTQLFENVALKIAAGDVGNSLRKVHTHIVNTAHVVDGKGDTEHLELMEKNTEGQENQIFIVFDEVQAAFVTDKAKVLGHLLLTAMDNKFPYMAFACTINDFKEHVSKNEGFMRRVLVINVEALKEKQTYAVLANNVLEDAPEVFISPEVLRRVAYLSEFEEYRDVFAGCPQPNTSQRILGDAIVKAELKKLEVQRDALIERKQERETNSSESKFLDDPLPYTEEGANLFDNNLDQEIADLTQQIEEANGHLQAFQGLLKQKDELTATIKNLAIKIEEKKGKASDQELKEFILMANYLKPALKQHIELQKSTVTGIYPEITLEDIESCIREEAESLRAGKLLREKPATPPLQKQIAQLEIKKLQLEIMRLEDELGLPPSELPFRDQISEEEGEESEDELPDLLTRHNSG